MRNLFITLQNRFSSSPFLRDFRNYAIGDIFLKILALVSIAVYTRILSVNDYGIISVYSTYVAMSLIVLTLGFHSAVSRYYFEKNKHNFEIFVGTSLVGGYIIFLFFALFIYIFRDALSIYLNLPSLVILLIVPSTLINIVSSVFSQIYAAERKSRQLTIINVMQSYTVFIVSIILIYSYNSDKYLGMIQATLIVSFIISLYMLYLMRHQIKFAFNPEHIKYILIFSIPLIPYHLGSLILNQFDKVMINSQLGNYESGLYSFAVNIAMLYLMFTALTLKAFAADYFTLMNEKKYYELDGKVFKILRIYFIIAIVIILFGKELISVFADAKFLKSVEIIPVITLGYVFFSIFEIYGRNAIYANKTIYSSINVLIPGILNIILNIYFIKEFGYIGAAYATLISYILMAILSYIISTRIIKVHSFPMQAIVKPFIIFLIFYVLYFILIILNLNFFVLIVLKSLSVIVFTILILKINFNYADEKR